MLEIIESKNEDGDVIEMSSMSPMQVGIIVSGSNDRLVGRSVMRTQSEDCFEVLDLSYPDAGSFTKNHRPFKVRLLKKGESITIKLFNE